MKKLILGAVGLVAINSAVFAQECGCSEPPVPKKSSVTIGYVTKEYVDDLVSKLNQRLDAISNRLAVIEKDLANPNADISSLKEKIVAIESSIASLKNDCPDACKSKLDAIERNIDTLKAKLQSHSAHAEKLMEEKARK